MINIKKLCNGITVVMEPMPYFRSAAIGVFVKVGSAFETEKTNGISHAVEHMLFKGTSKRSARDLADEMSQIGGNINAYTAKEDTCYFAKVLDEHLYEAIDILGDMLTNSVLDKNDIKKELGVILEEIDMYDDSPEDLVQEDVQQISWKDHPLGYLISGEKETVKHFTQKDIIDFMKQYYVAERMVISVAGSFEEEQLMWELNKNFGQIPSNPLSIELTKPIFTPSIHLIDKDIEQAHICLGYESVSYDTRDKYPLSVMDSVIAGSMNSRLFQTIREDKGLTYSIYSFSSTFKKTGIFQLYFAMNPTQLPAILEEIVRELDGLRMNGIKEEELICAKQQMKAEVLMGRESTTRCMDNNGKDLINRGFVVPAETTLRHLELTTIEEVKDHIDRYLKHQCCSLSFVGDLGCVDTAHITEYMKFKL